jgi:hypothetical protein
MFHPETLLEKQNMKSSRKQIRDKVPLNVVDERLTLLLRIREVPASNIELENGYPD